VTERESPSEEAFHRVNLPAFEQAAIDIRRPDELAAISHVFPSAVVFQGSRPGTRARLRPGSIVGLSAVSALMVFLAAQAVGLTSVSPVLGLGAAVAVFVALEIFRILGNGPRGLDDKAVSASQGPEGRRREIRSRRRILGDVFNIYIAEGSSVTISQAPSAVAWEGNPKNGGTKND
jgi:hypothetical protein